MDELIPISLRDSIPTLYQTKETKDPVCHIKLFTPDSNWTWYVIELFKEDMDTCYGYVQGLENELGYFSLKELRTIKGFLGLAVERDVLFKPTPLSQIQKSIHELRLYH